MTTNNSSQQPENKNTVGQRFEDLRNYQQTLEQLQSSGETEFTPEEEKLLNFGARHVLKKEGHDV